MEGCESHELCFFGLLYWRKYSPLLMSSTVDSENSSAADFVSWLRIFLGLVLFAVLSLAPGVLRVMDWQSSTAVADSS